MAPPRQIAAAPRGKSEFEPGAELDAPVDAVPGRVDVLGRGTGRLRGVTEDLLLIGGGRVQQVGPLNRQLEEPGRRNPERRIEEPGRLLEHREADAAVEILGQIARPPVIRDAQAHRPLLVQRHRVERVVRNAGQALRVEHEAGAAQRLLPRTECPDIATRRRGDQVRVLDPRLVDIGVVELRAEPAQPAGQEVEEGLVAHLHAHQLAAVLHIARPVDLDGLGRAAVGNGAQELAIGDGVVELLVEQADRQRGAGTHIAFERQVELVCAQRLKRRVARIRREHEVVAHDIGCGLGRGRRVEDDIGRVRRGVDQQIVDRQCVAQKADIPCTLR
eukprot:Opistho-1_new@84070